MFKLGCPFAGATFILHRRWKLLHYRRMSNRHELFPGSTLFIGDHGTGRSLSKDTNLGSLHSDLHNVFDFRCDVLHFWKMFQDAILGFYSDGNLQGKFGKFCTLFRILFFTNNLKSFSVDDITLFFYRQSKKSFKLWA